MITCKEILKKANWKIICINCGTAVDGLKNCERCKSSYICVTMADYIPFHSGVTDELSKIIVKNKKTQQSVLANCSLKFLKTYFPSLLDCDVIATIPSFNSKYNPMEHIGKYIANHIQKPLVLDLFVKEKDIKSKDYDWPCPLYRENLPVLLKYQNSDILIVDDVLTHGQTIGNIISILKQYNIKAKAFVIARTLGSSLIWSNR